MKVKDVMTSAPRACGPDTNLAVAAELMLDADCGFLPVVDDGRLVGVVTDRDMYIALATRNRPASDLRVRDVARTEVFSCGPDDDVQVALSAMRDHRVRRLPVEGFGHALMGVVSVNDLSLAAGPRKPIRSDEIVETLQAICAHHHPAPHVTSA